MGLDITRCYCLPVSFDILYRLIILPAGKAKLRYKRNISMPCLDSVACRIHIADCLYTTALDLENDSFTVYTYISTIRIVVCYESKRHKCICILVKQNVAKRPFHRYVILYLVIHGNDKIFWITWTEKLIYSYRRVTYGITNCRRQPHCEQSLFRF